MGADHGVFMEPSEGSAKDVRYTRSKDNTTLYAILLGWDKGQEEIILSTLSSDRIDIENLKTVSLISGKAGEYLPLSFRQDTGGLTATLPEKPREELAYVLKLSFEGKIPSLDKYVDIDCTPHYHIVPGSYMNNPVLGADLTLHEKSKDTANQWKFEPAGKGFYNIQCRENINKVLTYNMAGDSNQGLIVSDFTGEDNQLWKIETSFSALYKISNKQFPNHTMSVSGGIQEGKKAEMKSGTDS